MVLYQKIIGVYNIMDTRQIKMLMKDFDQSGLTRVKIEQEGFSIEMEKAAPTTAVVSAPEVVTSVPVATAPSATSAAQTESAPATQAHTGDFIYSPMVGTFYEAPSPDSPPFVKVGDIVKKGQTLAILEAMKIMNELEADFDCKIVDILVKNGQAVEYDMPLFAVEKI